MVQGSKSSRSARSVLSSVSRVVMGTLLIASPIHAALGGVTPISDTRSVAVSVVAQGLLDPTDSDSFFDSALVPYAPYVVATTTRTASTSEAFAQAGTAQSSTVSPDEFTMVGHVTGNARGDSFAGQGIATASSSLQIGFRADSPFSVRIHGSLINSRARGQVSLLKGENTLYSATDGAFDTTLELEAGEYLAIAETIIDLNQTSSTGQIGQGTLVVSYTFTGGGTGCVCVADFDGSGGTPDSTDIEAFFAAWLAGDAGADADCSGGTPDSTDIDVFFREWLAGGC